MRMIEDSFVQNVPASQSSTIRPFSIFKNQNQSDSSNGYISWAHHRTNTSMPQRAGRPTLCLKASCFNGKTYRLEALKVHRFLVHWWYALGALPTFPNEPRVLCNSRQHFDRVWFVYILSGFWRHTQIQNDGQSRVLHRVGTPWTGGMARRPEQFQWFISIRVAL